MVDHATVWVEWPIRRLTGSARLNPLPHAGTISVFLLGLVVVSGLYITLFFEFGHEASYRSVAEMEEHAIQRVVRALHRYASAALVVTTVVHAWRIFAAGRFTGRLRRWRWATGVAALVLVWLAGVTGYWLVWDVRAQAINEIVLGLVGTTGFGAAIGVDHLGVVGDRSGSGFLLLVWFAHLGLSAAIGWFAWRHLRRTKQPWFPSPHWMALMGVPLVLVSLAVPVGMLAPADPTILVGEIPLDPFVLFLLPPLLSSWRWVTVALAVAVGLMVTVLPRLLRRRDPEVISVIDDACTGCELCVADCPYDALHMIDRHTGRTAAVATRTPEDGTGATDGDRRHLLAVVDADRCVGCGVCLGSCAFGAIDLPGAVAPPPLEASGLPLVVVCDRHLDRIDGAGGSAIESAGAPEVVAGGSAVESAGAPEVVAGGSAIESAPRSLPPRSLPAARPSSPTMAPRSLPTGRAIGRCCTRSAAPEHWHPAPSAASASSVPPSSSWSVVPRTTVATGSATPWPPSGCGGADGPTRRRAMPGGSPRTGLPVIGSVGPWPTPGSIPSSTPAGHPPVERRWSEWLSSRWPPWSGWPSPLGPHSVGPPRTVPSGW